MKYLENASIPTNESLFSNIKRSQVGGIERYGNGTEGMLNLHLLKICINVEQKTLIFFMVIYHISDEELR